MRLPEFIKRPLRATAQWLPIGLAPARQQEVEVRLIAPGRTIDVTHRSVVAAMRPLTLALGLDDTLAAWLAAAPRPRLHLVDCASQTTLGWLQLRLHERWAADGVPLALFEVDGGHHRCAGLVRRTWDDWLYRRGDRRRQTQPGHFAMSQRAVQQMMVFYLRPRPVLLVSVDDGRHSNIFPMDLLGPVNADRFTLALRSTSPSAQTMQDARRVALSTVAAADCAVAYRLGAHHRQAQVDWTALPFATARSERFGLPVPASALQVRELEILDLRTVGSHQLFVGRIVSDSGLAGGAALFHTCAIHQRFRRRAGRPFDVAST